MPNSKSERIAYCKNAAAYARRQASAAATSSARRVLVKMAENYEAEVGDLQKSAPQE